MNKIKSIVTNVIALDTRSLEFGVSTLNLIVAYWFFLPGSNNDRAMRIYLSGSAWLWGSVFMFLFAAGFVLVYRALESNELVLWKIRWVVLTISSILWFSFALLFLFLDGVYSLSAFIFFGVGVVALFGSVLIRWDFE